VPKYLRSHSSSKKIIWQEAPDVKKRLTYIVSSLGIKSLNIKRIFCLRSTNSKTRAYARIWGLTSIWQQVLKIKPCYIVEVISEKYDNLEQNQKDRILLHELNHIPKNFSGALVPHFRRGKRSFKRKLEELVSLYVKSNRL